MKLKSYESNSTNTQKTLQEMAIKFVKQSNWANEIPIQQRFSRYKLNSIWLCVNHTNWNDKHYLKLAMSMSTVNNYKYSQIEFRPNVSWIFQFSHVLDIQTNIHASLVATSNNHVTHCESIECWFFQINTAQQVGFNVGYHLSRTKC